MRNLLKVFIAIFVIQGCKNYSSDLGASKNVHSNTSVPDGNYVTYYQNDKIKEKGKYQDGKKEGYWKTYDQDGTVNSISYYKNDSIKFTTTDGSDYDLKGIHVAALRTTFVLPKKWRISPEMPNIIIVRVKEDSGKYSPNMNVVVFPFQNKSLNEYLEKKIAGIKNNYHGELVYQSTNPHFPDTNNYFIKCRIISDSLLITFFIFMFVRENHLIEENLSCDAEQEIQYEDLAMELVTDIKFDQ